MDDDVSRLDAAISCLSPNFAKSTLSGIETGSGMAYRCKTEGRSCRCSHGRLLLS